MQLPREEQARREQRQVQKIFTSIQSGDLAELNRLLPLNSQDPELFLLFDNYGFDALLLAKKVGNQEINKYLYDFGVVASKRGRNFYKRNELHWAAAAGMVERVNKNYEDAKEGRYSLGYDDPTSKYETPLSLAARNGHVEMVKLLIKRGAKPNPQDRVVEFPLAVAAGQGQLEVVDALLSIYPDREQRIRYASNAINNAARGGHLDVVKFLLQNGAENNKAVKSAILNGHFEVVKQLIDAHGERYFVQDFKDDFSLAAEHNQVDVLKAMLETREKIKSPIALNINRAIEFAIEQHGLKVIKPLLLAGLDVTPPQVMGAKDIKQKPEEYLVLWQERQTHRQFPLDKQVIHILKLEDSALNKYKGLTGLKSLFFKPVQEVASQLATLRLEADPHKQLTQLREFIMANEENIPPIKYDFILNYLLQVRDKTVEEHMEEFTDWGPSPPSS